MDTTMPVPGSSGQTTSKACRVITPLNRNLAPPLDILPPVARRGKVQMNPGNCQ
jgi:hypothetical protein